jgi:ATP-dependent DNA helicase RecQ
MQIQIFEAKQGDVEEVNKFLRSHKVLSNSKAFNPLNGSWSVLIEYLPDAEPIEVIKEKRKQRVDYMKELSVEDFAKFRVLRFCRKTIADEDGVKAYVILLDVDLVQLVNMDITMQSLASIKGFGEQKLSKYGERFIKYWNEYKSMIPKYIEEGEKNRGNISDSDQH